MYAVDEIVSIRSGIYAGRVGRICELDDGNSTVTVAVTTPERSDRVCLGYDDIRSLPAPSVEELVAPISISISQLSTCLSELKSQPLRMTAFNFFENLTTIRSLISLPFNLTMHEEKASLGYAIYMAALVASGHDFYDIPKLSESDQNEIEVKEERLWEQIGGKEFWEKRYPGMGYNTFFQHLKDNEIVETATRSLLSAAIVQGWGAFEILVTDLWITALNGNPRFAHNSLATLTSRSAAQNPKQITVDDLAVFGFDLRDHMGTLLSERFKFTGVEPIEKSYLAAFGGTSGCTQRIKSIFEKPPLRELEATRHLLAHKNGVVDKKFNQKAKTNLPLGEPVPLDFRKIKILVDAAVDTGVEMIKFVEGQIQAFANKPTTT